MKRGKETRQGCGCGGKKLPHSSPFVKLLLLLSFFTTPSKGAFINDLSKELIIIEMWIFRILFLIEDLKKKQPSPKPIFLYSNDFIETTVGVLVQDKVTLSNSSKGRVVSECRPHSYLRERSLSKKKEETRPSVVFFLFTGFTFRRLRVEDWVRQEEFIVKRGIISM